MYKTLYKLKEIKEMKKALGERLKELRQAKNIKRSAIAVLLQVSVSAVSMWENGDRTPKLEQIKRLAEIYGCSVEYIVGDCAEEINKLSIKQYLLLEMINRLSDSQVEILLDFLLTITK